MSEEVDLGKSFCLFDGKHFVKLHVTPEATEEEVQNVVLLRGALPRLKLQPLGPSTETSASTSFLALGSRICCVACPDPWPNNKVKMFNPNAKQLKFDNLFPDMNEKRTFPAVAAIGGLIYVFGGLRYDEDIDPERIWAEYLDTSQPRDKQAWMPLPQPPFPLQHDMLLSFPLGDEQILVFDNDLTKNGFLYDVKDRSWTVYKFMDEDTDGDWVNEPQYLSNPILGGHKTIYWLFGHVFCAFELESKKLYRGFVNNSVLPDYHGDFPFFGVPSNAVLMHLKDDVFCFFTFYYKKFDPDNECGVLECTKIRVAKTDGHLEIDVIGYQSYQCGDMWRLIGGVNFQVSKWLKKKIRNHHSWEMSEVVDLGKSFCLFDGKHFVKLHVTPEATEEEVQNVDLLRGAVRRLKLQTLGPSTETPIGTSFLALGSKICCVACSETWPNNKVKNFDPNAKQLKFRNSFPDMNEKRTFPAVAAIGGLIYVFGGLRYDEHIDPERIWAEYLDTSQPRDKQAWMPLPKPPFPLQHDMLFSFPLGDEQILVFDNNLTKNGFLYDVKDRFWTEYKFMDKDTDGDWVREPLYLLNPILDGHKTIYWLFGHVFCAFELESKKFYRGVVKNSVLPDYRGDFPLLGVPSNAVLMHLKDDVFCFFTFYYKYFAPDNKFGILECTKIRVAKTDGPLKIDVIGYQSYDCGDMWTLNGGVSISKSLNGSKKRRNRHREKHNH